MPPPTRTSKRLRERWERENRCCSICFEPEPKEGEANSEQCPACGYRFHFQCIRPWVERKHMSCPNCRESDVFMPVYAKIRHVVCDICDEQILPRDMPQKRRLSDGSVARYGGKCCTDCGVVAHASCYEEHKRVMLRWHPGEEASALEERWIEMGREHRDHDYLCGVCFRRNFKPTLFRTPTGLDVGMFLPRASTSNVFLLMLQLSIVKWQLDTFNLNMSLTLGLGPESKTFALQPLPETVDRSVASVAVVENLRMLSSPARTHLRKGGRKGIYYVKVEYIALPDDVFPDQSVRGDSYLEWRDTRLPLDFESFSEQQLIRPDDHPRDMTRNAIKRAIAIVSS